MNATYPNPLLLWALEGLDDQLLIRFLNPSRKKKERLAAICDHLKYVFTSSSLIDVTFFKTLK